MNINLKNIGVYNFTVYVSKSIRTKEVDLTRF